MFIKKPFSTLKLFLNKNIGNKKLNDSTSHLIIGDFNLSKKNSNQISKLMELIVDFDSYLPTNSNHINSKNVNHLNDIKDLRSLISKVKVNLKPSFLIISNLEHNNFILHDSILSCGMILGFLQAWDEHQLLTKNQYKKLNLLLVLFSKNMHNVLAEIKVSK